MSDNIVIVSRHAGLLAWLNAHGIAGKVVTGNATVEDVAGKDVYGILPLWLAAHANSVTEVSMPKLPFEMRGKEYTPEQMDEWGAHLSTFYVRTPDKFITGVQGCGALYYADGTSIGFY
jgi:putative CRISPR-associated protein (TIGR02620 family)